MSSRAFTSRLVLLGLAATLLLVPASASAGTLTLTLAGAGGGTVKSKPVAIDCSNAGNPGGPGTGECSKDFGFAEVPLKLTATPGSSLYVFAGWSGAGAGSCTGSASLDCQLSVGFLGTTAVTATFIPKPPLATVTTEGVAPGVAGHVATLEGAVNPNGSGLVECRFEYGPTPAYGASVPCTQSAASLGSGSSAVPVSAETESLEPGATYHYQLVAVNFAGAAGGADQTFTTAPAGPDNCSNAARRAEQGIAALLLPSCMALEMVSPPQKSGQPAQKPSLSADGERLLFQSAAGLGGTPGVLNVAGDIYVATRGQSRWETEPTVPPAQYPRGWGFTAVAQSFSPDLSSWFQIASTFSQFEAGIAQSFDGGLGGVFTPFSPLLAPPGGASPDSVRSLSFQAASADHSNLYFAPGLVSVTYLSVDAVPAGAPADDNVYLAALDAAGEPSLALLARDEVGPDAGKVWGGRCGVRMGGNKQANKIITRNQGAVSADGSLTYFSTRPSQPQTGFCSEASKLRIMLRTETPGGAQIEQLIPNEGAGECTRVSPSCSNADGDDRFQGASTDSTKVYLTTSRQLASSDTDASNDLYLYDATEPAGQHLTQVSAGGVGDTTPGAGANVQGNLTALSTDGSHAYFVATDVLTSAANPAGASAVAGQPNLYLWNADTEATSFLATLSSGDSEGLWGNLNGFQNGAYPVPATGQDPQGTEVGGDGHVLAFQSKASLTAGDADGGRLDVFRYDSVAGTLACVSCKPSGADSEPFDVAKRAGAEGPLGTDFAELNRWTSEDGETIVFTSAEPLLSGDRNQVSDFFIWREGQLYRLPGRAYVSSPSESNVPTLSHSGDEVAFQTGTALLPFDGDNAPDVYVARVGGGYAYPSAPPVCAGEGCQEPFSLQSGDVHLGPPPSEQVLCRKGLVRRHGKCVKKPNRPKKHKKQHHSKHEKKANSDRRAAK